MVTGKGTKQVLFALTVCTSGVTGAALTQSSITVPSGSDLRVGLDEGARVKKAGQAVHGTLLAPLYIGESLAVPAGTAVGGHIADILPGAKGARVSRLLNGDFTPTHTTTIAWDELVLRDGTRVPVQAAPSCGANGVHLARYYPKGEKPGFKAKLHEAAEPLRAPHKLQRLGELAFSALPLHPNYVDQGAVYNAVLTAPVTLKRPTESGVTLVREEFVDPPNTLYLRLATPVTSAEVAGGEPISGFVTRPYYDSKHTLLYPAGTQVTGTVKTAKAAKWLHRDGALRFNFNTILSADGVSHRLGATLNGVEAQGGDNLSVDSEGGLHTTNPLLDQGFALSALINPSLGISDPHTYEKTVFERGGDGQSGFGFVGAGAAQASAGAALGFGYYGAAKAIYAAFLARGTNVVLPTYTPLMLHMDDAVEAANISPAADIEVTRADEVEMIAESN